MARKYPRMLTAKSSAAINARAERLAAEAGRNRSEYLRDVINTLAAREDLRQAVNQALPTAE